MLHLNTILISIDYCQTPGKDTNYTHSIGGLNEFKQKLMDAV